MCPGTAGRRTGETPAAETKRGHDTHHCLAGTPAVRLSFSGTGRSLGSRTDGTAPCGETVPPGDRKPFPQADGAAEESSTGEIRLGGEEQENPSELELVLKLEEETEPSKPETPEPAGAASAPQPGPEKPQVSQPKAPETPAPQPDKKPTEKQSASRKKAVQYGPRTPQEQYEDREMK